MDRRPPPSPWFWVMFLVIISMVLVNIGLSWSARAQRGHIIDALDQCMKTCKPR